MTFFSNFRKLLTTDISDLRLKEMNFTAARRFQWMGVYLCEGICSDCNWLKIDKPTLLHVP